MKQHILICGDFCPQDRVNIVLNNSLGGQLLEDWLILLSKMDYSIVNLECPVVKDNVIKSIEKVGPCLHTTELSIKLLCEVGFNMVTLANNHFFDCGQKGVKNTLELLEKYGLDYVGGGENRKQAEGILYLSLIHI